MKLLIGLLCAAVCSAVPNNDRVVFVKGGQLFSVRLDGSGLQQLTTDGGDKSHPRQSPDGTRIAFGEAGDRSRALGYIGLITAKGEAMKVIPFRPVGPIPIGGMRYIEDLQWVGSNRLAVSGSVNPENCEYVVLDLDTAQEVKGEIGACRSFALSPDGAHLASFVAPGIGVAQEDRAIGIQIDHRVVYTGDRKQIAFESRIAWSADNSRFAVIRRDAALTSRRVLVVTRDGRRTEISLSGDAADANEIRWLGGSPYVRGHATFHRVDLDANKIVIAGLEAVRALESIDESEQTQAAGAGRAEALVRSLGGRDADMRRIAPTPIR